jgi:hypothetical protein
MATPRAHSEMDGGVHAVEILDTRPVWAASSFPSRSAASCPDGYTNMGLTCYSWSKVETLSGGTDPMICPEGQLKELGICVSCPTDKSYWGGLCYVNCPPNAIRTAVSTCLHKISMSGNTHLFVVNRALDLLAKSDDQRARTIAQVMNKPEVRKNWEQGLWDGDDSDHSDAGSVLRSGSHFYNGAGKDYFGNATKITTYEMLGSDANATPQGHNPNAREMARSYLSRVSKNELTSANPGTAAHNLGLALHYASDMTQPLHTSGFSGASVPTNLHPVYEFYVAFIQSRFPANFSWDKRFAGRTADDAFHDMSVKSNGFAKDLINEMHVDGSAGICTIQSMEGVGPYTGYCFVDDWEIDRQTGLILMDGYQSLASYIFAALTEKGF